MRRIRVCYWSPFIDKVATTKAVFNSVLSLNTYSKKKFEGIIINVFGEWLNYNSNKNSYIKFYDLNNFSFLKKFSSRGFIKSRLKYFLIFILSYFPLKNFLKKEKPEYLIIHLITSLPLFLNLVNNFDTKIILRISGKPQLNFLRYLFWRLTLKKIHKVTFPTNETLNYFKELNIVDENKLQLLYDPIVHTRYLGKIKNDKFIKQNEFYLAIGRFTRQKNFHKYLSNCKLFILSSLWEDPGFVLVEAMFSGALVLSSDCPSGPKEILSINKKRGVLFKSNDTKDFIKKFYEIEKLEDYELNKMKLNAKIFTKNYTLFYHYNSLIKILD